MKKLRKFLWVAMAVCLGATALSACDDDDDKDWRPNGGGASDIVGTYTGSVGAKVSGTDLSISGTYDVVIKSQPREDDEVIVVLPEVKYSAGPMGGEKAIPALTVSEVDVDRTGQGADTYILEEDDYVLTIDNVIYSGSIYGTVKGSDIILDYTVTPGNMPMPINFHFTGKYQK